MIPCVNSPRTTSSVYCQFSGFRWACSRSTTLRESAARPWSGSGSPSGSSNTRAWVLMVAGRLPSKSRCLNPINSRRVHGQRRWSSWAAGFPVPPCDVLRRSSKPSQAGHLNMQALHPRFRLRLPWTGEGTEVAQCTQNVRRKQLVALLIGRR